MYEELVKRLRMRARLFKQINQMENCIMDEAADAIEELSTHYCPHMIRNVHDRGDDSLCRVLGVEPPKEET